MPIPLRVALTVAFVVLAYVLSTYVHVYNGLNKGVTVGPCGVEVVGVPGWFCGDY